MSKRRKFSAESKRGAVAQASQPRIRHPGALEWGIRPSPSDRWKREAQSPGALAFGGTGTPRDEELARLKPELARAGPPQLLAQPKVAKRMPVLASKST